MIASHYKNNDELFKSLKLKPQPCDDKNYPVYLGQITFEHGTIVKLWVNPNGDFYKAEIGLCENGKTYQVLTGSGYLCEYWPTIYLIAYSYLVVSEVE